MQRGRDADVAGEGRGRLVADRRLPGLVAEAAEHHPAFGLRPDQVRPAADAVAVGVVGVGQRQDVGLRHRLEQAEPDHLRRHPRRDLHVRADRPVGEIGDRDSSAGAATPPRRRRASPAPRRSRSPSAPRPAGPAPRRSAAGRRRSARAGWRDSPRSPPAPAAGPRPRAGTDSRRNMPTAGSSGPVGGCAAPVLQVAGLAGAGVEERPQPVRARVEDGAVTQSLRKKPLPTLKSSSRSNDMLRRGLREGVGVDRPAARSPRRPAAPRSAPARRSRWPAPSPPRPAPPRRRCAATTAGAAAAAPAAAAAGPAAPARRPSRRMRALLEHRVRIVEAVGALEGDVCELQRRDRPLDRAGLRDQRVRRRPSPAPRRRRCRWRAAGRSGSRPRPRS